MILHSIFHQQTAIHSFILNKKTENFDQVLTDHAQARDDWR
jgi:segregation and condensation protein A